MIKRFAVVVIGLFILNVHAWAYTPPVAIPDPAWGALHPVDTVAPNAQIQCPNWPGAASSGCYYIDSTHPAATDSSNTNGYPNKPRLTIPKTTYAAGSYVEMHGGPYAWSSGGTVTFNGTEANPCWFRGTAALKPTFTGEFIPKGSYVFIEHINFDTGIAGMRQHSGSTLDHAVLRHCTMKGAGTNIGNGAAVSIGSGSAGTHHDIVIYNNTISYYGIYNTETENDFHGVSPGNNATNIWILSNRIHHMGGDGIGNAHDANHTTHGIFIGGNTIHSNRENAIDYKEVHNVVISQNTFYNFRFEPADGGGGAALVFHYGPTTGEGPYNIWVINNLIYDSVRAIAVSDCQQGLYFIGNVIRDCTTAFSATYSGGGSYYLYHNTIANCTSGLVVGVNADAFEARGNIVHNIGPGGYNLRIDNTSLLTKAQISDELYDGSTVSIKWGNNTYSSVSNWVSSTGKVNIIQTDPQFTNSATNDFSIAESSPARDAGYNMAPVMSNFATTFGAYLNMDIAGSTRPEGTWASGAYEFSTGPKVPRNLRVQ